MRNRAYRVSDTVVKCTVKCNLCDQSETVVEKEVCACQGVKMPSILLNLDVEVLVLNWQLCSTNEVRGASGSSASELATL